MPHSRAQHSTAQQCCIEEHSAAQQRCMKRAQRSTAQHSTAQHGTIARTPSMHFAMSLLQLHCLYQPAALFTQPKSYLISVLFPNIGSSMHPYHPMLICRNFYKMDLGPKPGVSLRVAVLAEGALTYLLNLVILYATSELLTLRTPEPASNSHRQIQVSAAATPVAMHIQPACT